MNSPPGAPAFAPYIVDADCLIYIHMCLCGIYVLHLLCVGGTVCTKRLWCIRSNYDAFTACKTICSCCVLAAKAAGYLDSLHRPELTSVIYRETPTQAEFCLRVITDLDVPSHKHLRRTPLLHAVRGNADKPNRKEGH